MASLDPSPMMRLTVAEALLRLVRDKEEFARLLGKSGFDVGLYKPDEIDTQTPHARDELYVVAVGSGQFVCGRDRTHVGPGDLLFVQAGEAHRFENFTDDFCAWVIFIGKRP
jgi:mannose-6-phosphate isomerase-like protein (cupin superfamily)